MFLFAGQLNVTVGHETTAFVCFTIVLKEFEYIFVIDELTLFIFTIFSIWNLKISNTNSTNHLHWLLLFWKRCVSFGKQKKTFVQSLSLPFHISYCSCLNPRVRAVWEREIFFSFCLHYRDRSKNSRVRAVCGREIFFSFCLHVRDRSKKNWVYSRAINWEKDKFCTLEKTCWLMLTILHNCLGHICPDHICLAHNFSAHISPASARTTISTQNHDMYIEAA
jgi:hypothetical protein